MLHEIISAAEFFPQSAAAGSQAELISYCRPDLALQADKARRWGVIICPGGGYQMLAPTEGEPVALRFLAAGVQAFVLHYSTLPTPYPQQLLDLAGAVSWLRNNQARYNIDRIAVCGFSAGGHLAGCLANLWQDDVLKPIQQDAALLRPDAAILCYPVVSMDEHPGLFELISAPEKTSLERSVTGQNPPVFLWCTCSDEMVTTENTLSYAAALRKAGTPFELHIFPNGPHAMATATAESAPGKRYINDHVANWLPLCIEWLHKEV